MGSGFKLKIAPPLALFELSREGAFDITRPGIMAFDEIAVVCVHDAHELRQIRGGAGMKGMSQFCRRGGEFWPIFWPESARAL